MDGCFLIFDLTNRESFEKVPKWIKELHTYGPGSETKILVGNKLDLADRDIYRTIEDPSLFEIPREREVTKEEARELAKEMEIKYMEVSAKNGEGVE